MQNLNTTGLKNPFRQLRLTHISLYTVGLMWIFPFLHYRHQYPLTTFHQEWWSAIFGLLALFPLLTRDYWLQPEIPRIVQMPICLIGVLILQINRIAYYEQALLYALYLLFATLLMMLGHRLRTCFGLTKLALVLAMFLLAGAEISATIGVLQHYRWHTPLDMVIIVKTSPSVFGNLAQPNHFADYIALGLASLGLLYRQQRLNAVYVIALAAPLLFVMTLSGSRSSWLYLLMMTGLSWWWMRRDAAQRPLLYYCLLLIAGFCAMHLIVQMQFMAAPTSNFDTMQRLFNEESGGIRFYLWREAWLIFMQFPWLGAGFGQFAWQHFQLLPLLQQGNIVGLYNNAHNLVFQLAAETGMSGLLALFAALGIWFYGLRRATLSAAHWWGYAVLGVLAIHSLLEYPLWYAYFIAIAAVLLGALDETCYRLELRNMGRISSIAILLMGLLILVQLRIDHYRLESVLTMRPASANDTGAIENMRDGLIKMQKGSLLSPYDELYMSSMIKVSSENIAEKLSLNTRVLYFAPIGVVAYRQALLLAQADKKNEAQDMLKQAIWSYPGEFTNAYREMTELSAKDPAHYSALLEFALQKEQEYRRAVRH